MQKWMAAIRRIESKESILPRWPWEIIIKLSANQREREFTVFVFVLILRVQWPKLADASACQLALLPRELVSTCSVLVTSKLPSSNWSRKIFPKDRKLGNDKTNSNIFSTVCSQPQQMCDNNPCFTNEENSSWCVCMVSQSSPVITRATRGFSALRHIMLL